MNFYDMNDRRSQNMDTYLARKRLTMPKQNVGPPIGSGRRRATELSGQNPPMAAFGSRGFDAKKLYRDRVNTVNNNTSKSKRPLDLKAL